MYIYFISVAKDFDHVSGLKLALHQFLIKRENKALYLEKAWYRIINQKQEMEKWPIGIRFCQLLPL